MSTTPTTNEKTPVVTSDFIQPSDRCEELMNYIVDNYQLSLYDLAFLANFLTTSYLIGVANRNKNLVNNTHETNE